MCACSFVQAARRIAAMTIGAAEHDIVIGLMHRLDAVMTLETADAFRVGLGLGLIDPIARRQWRPGRLSIL